MKILIIILSLIFSPQTFSKSCSSVKPLPQVGCTIECKDDKWFEDCSDQKCGTKPLPSLGCKIGDCVNGRWETVCDCGVKPVRNRGCKVTECKDGKWVEDCSKRKCPSLKTLSAPGCKVECEEGEWIQKCV